MMGLTVAASDPAIEALLRLLSDPKAAAKAKQLLEELKAATAKHDQAATLARAQAADAANERRIAEKLLAEVTAKERELDRRAAQLEVRQIAVAEKEAKIQKLRQEFASA
jgi:hypothetical protein